MKRIITILLLALPRITFGQAAILDTCGYLRPEGLNLVRTTLSTTHDDKDGSMVLDGTTSVAVITYMDISAPRTVLPANVVVTSSAGSLTLSPWHYYIFTGTTATYTVPSAFNGTGRQIRLENRGSGTLTISASDLFTTSVVSSLTMAPGDLLNLNDDGSYWKVENYTYPGGGGSGTVTSVSMSGGTTGLTFTGGPVTTSGTFTAGGTLAVANGGTGTSSPGLVAGTNVTISGSWPNQTINSSGGGGGLDSSAGKAYWWDQSGNSTSTTKYLGTTSSQGFGLITNNSEVIHFNANGTMQLQSNRYFLLPPGPLYFNSYLDAASYMTWYSTYMSTNGGIGLHVGGLGVEPASAILSATSTTKGFLPPQMTTTQRNAISSPASGLTVYDITVPGEFYYDGTNWIQK